MKKITSKYYFLVMALALTACGGQSANNANVSGNVNTANRATVNNAANMTTNANAAPPRSVDLSQVFSGKTMPVEERVAAIQKYVDEVESRLPKTNPPANPLQRKEVILNAGSLKDATDENWAKMHIYSDGDTLKRLKVYAPAGSEKSEEFYFYNDKPVFVFIEPKGKDIEFSDQAAVGDRFYFGDEGLISWVKADGGKPAPADAEFKKQNDKLLKEATAFKNLK